jgi:anti-anti-sigma factor
VVIRGGNGVTQSPYNWLEIDTIGDVMVVKFLTHAVVDERVIRIVSDELFRLEQLGHRLFLLDFSLVRHLSSSILATLIKLHKKLQESGGTLALCAIDHDILPVFEVTHLNKILKIYDDRDEAIRALRPD